MNNNKHTTDSKSFRTVQYNKTVSLKSSLKPPLNVAHFPTSHSVESFPVHDDAKHNIEFDSSAPIRKFIERHNLPIEHFEYARDGTDPGIIIIFSYDSYENNSSPPREGANRDINEIILSMQRLGFNFHDSNICRNFTRDQIFGKIEQVKASKLELLQTNCLIVFFLTHGDDFEKLLAYDRSIYTHELWNAFDCPELKDKPKLYIFQACKGESWTTVDGKNGILTDEKSSDIVELNTYYARHMGPDIVVVYSTIEGNVSFRHGSQGSWFIQELCKIFSVYGRRDDVLSLLVRITKCVSGNYYNEDYDFGIQKQMPMFVSTLSKKFYLNRNKDRAMLIQIQNKQDQMFRLVEDLQKKVNTLCK